MSRLFVLFLCMLLPLQGFAAWQVPASLCPMQGTMAMADCCNDMDTFERTGQPCKSVQSCASPAAGLFSLPSLEARTLKTQDPQAPAWRSLSLGATSRLWRPPTSV